MTHERCRHQFPKSRAPWVALLVCVGLSVGCGTARSEPAWILADESTFAPAAVAPSAEVDSAEPLSPFASILDTAQFDPEGRTTVGVELAQLGEDLIVVYNAPARALKIDGGGVSGLPHLFEGLRSPDPALPPDQFAVWGLHGSYQHMAFRLDAPTGGYSRHVRGTPGAWQIEPVAERSVDTRTLISVPIERPDGGRLYERARSVRATGRQGFEFVVEGASTRVKPPLAAAGANGCKSRLLGHPYIAYLPDGSLVGVGSECQAADAPLPIPVVKVETTGTAEVVVPRLGTGPLMVEHWPAEGSSRVNPLPGAEQAHPSASIVIEVRSARDVWIGTTISSAGRPRPYFALFDGATWRDVTPTAPDSMYRLYFASEGTPHLIGVHRSFRRSGDTWQSIVMPDPFPCNATTIGAVRHASNGTIWAIIGDCIMALGAGSTRFIQAPLPKEHVVVDFALLNDEPVVMAQTPHSRGVVLRLRSAIWRAISRDR